MANILTQNDIRHVDYKDVDLLRQFINPHGRIQSRNYGWHCGCTQQKILGAIAPAFRADHEALFGDGETIRVECPRCAAAHTLTREAMEAYLAESGKKA